MSTTEDTRGLTKREAQVMDHLVKATQSFYRLPGLPDCMVQEFRATIHRAQDLVAAVAMRRKHPEGWR